MANTRESFGSKILDARKKIGISQEELANKADITRTNLSRIENGKYKVGLDILLKIAEALNLELGFI